MGPQRHQVGDRGLVVGRGADDGHPRRVRPPLRPHRARAAAGGGHPGDRRRRSRPRADAAGRRRARRRRPKPTSATISGSSPKQSKPAIAKLVADGELERVDVDGWTAPAYLRAGQIVPRRDRGTALLCPFDPLIFFRPRVRTAVRQFHYRIEIYTPAAKRRYGYYVWPFLLDGRLVGRVDLKADRAQGRCTSSARSPKQGSTPSRVAAALAASCRRWRHGWGWAR